MLHLSSSALPAVVGTTLYVVRPEKRRQWTTSHDSRNLPQKSRYSITRKTMGDPPYSRPYTDSSTLELYKQNILVHYI